MMFTCILKGDVYMTKLIPSIPGGRNSPVFKANSGYCLDYHQDDN